MITMAKASAERVAEILDEQPDLHNPANPIHEVKDGAMWDTARGDSQMLIHIVGRTLKGQTIDEYQYVNSAGDGIELKPGDYELTVDEPPVATDGTRFRASKRMVPVSFNSQAPDTVDSTPQGGFGLYVDTQ